MHAIKGGWVGQTFALAKSNESEGRKSRIRRSKEERKAMVETFIQKHQKTHNGSFPSLNLTHKEVGGSFYTVREIVRDIIQENRVLGPAKFTEESQSSHFLEEDPLSSIASEHHNPLSMSLNDFQSLQNEYQGGFEELSTTSDRHHATPGHQLLDNGKFINGIPVERKEEGLGEEKEAMILETAEEKMNFDDSPDKKGYTASDGNHAFVENKMVNNDSLVDLTIIESHEINHVELQVDAESEADNFEDQSVASVLTVTPTAEDVKVEAFPMSPKTTENDLEGSLSEIIDEDKSRNFSETETEKVELAAEGSSETDKANSSPSSIVVDIVEDNETVKASYKDLISTTVIPEDSNTIAEAKAEDSLNGTKTKYADLNGGTNARLKTEKEVGIQQNDSPQKESKPTFDRINLESWDGTSKNPGRSVDNNPLWSVFKAFVNAFVKFWSE